MKYKYIRGYIHREKDLPKEEFLFELFQSDNDKDCLRANIYKIYNDTSHTFLAEATFHSFDTLCYQTKYPSYFNCIVSVYKPDGKFCYSFTDIDNRDTTLLTKVYEYPIFDSFKIEDEFKILRMVRKYIQEFATELYL